MDIRIRAADPSDVQEASKLQRAVIPGDHPYEYARNILCSGTVNLVAIHKGTTIAGYISVLVGGLNPNGQHLWERLRPYLAFVGVLPDLQGQHVGAELIRRALQASDPRGASGMWLECPESAAGFYEKVGFVRVTSEAIEQYTGLTPRGPAYRLASKPLPG
ncbi:GNAT family N-acetyltransferase [Frateuria sp. MAH-13]|uniref:GNAT family N-acetyltransferase n=1 Tax=Frateuria flava TaxID=2821489 RepID=A0ABS4DKD1_9GAMM|nr:GNAT family N-acetyltransferase [Frateuria flava]